jgi:hypothetical protein
MKLARVFIVIGAVTCGLAAVDRTTLSETGITRLAIPGRSNSAPSIAANGDLVVVAWHAAAGSGGGDIFVAVSRDGGATFGEPARVNAVAGEARSGGELPPRIAIAPAKGRSGPELIVVWRARRERTSLLVSRSIDGGRTFDDGTLLQSADAAGERGWQSTAIAPDGRVHAVWLDHRGLAPPPGVPHTHGAHRSTADGVEMAQKSGLYYAAIAASGRTGERELIKGVCYCCKTAVAAGPDGGVYAAWRHVYPGNIRDIAFLTSRDGGQSFDQPARVSEDGWHIAGCPDDGPSMAITPDRRVHVVWPTVIDEGGEPQGALFYAATGDGRTFSSRQRVPTLGGPKPTHPQIAAAADGLVLAWDEIVDGTRKSAVVIMRASATGTTTFGRPIVLDSSSTPSVYPAIASAASGLAIAWTSGMGDASVIAVRRFQPSSIGSQ